MKGLFFMQEKSRDAEFLNKVYQNAKMAEESITYVTDRVENSGLLSDLQCQHSQYSAISTKAAGELNNISQLPKDNSPIAKMGVWTGAKMNTLFDKTPDKIAEMMIQGSMMGVIDMTRTIKEYNDVPQDIKALGYELITVEENNVRRMKAYLGCS